MFPSIKHPPKKQRGRPRPEYGPLHCFWCARKPRFNLATRLFYCVCGWKE